ncbi:GGDEF domain-containing protein [Aliarcobacter cibarius]|uniref:diguanylate cyclase n=1 Tax=Aliarcobacter cibarius TaxID=255507 RepID=A0ABY2V6J9_9BACT|nr:GGDEF domain-containing protein [Aliarcobacter cibarius]TLS98814.1 diguanylate cyclase [Aliarcobacter cibarius]TLS99609.1 diguanylate cyclase [Aliarcobacter cibarius]
MQEFFENLCEIEKLEIKKNQINSAEGLISLLLKRAPRKNVRVLVNILKQSLLPSISQDENKELEELFLEIDKDENLIFEKEVQEKIEQFISQRFEKDKQVIIEKTSDLSKLVFIMEEFLNEAISSSGNGSKNVLNIKEKLKSIDINDGSLETLSMVQAELINAASSIEEEMNKVSNKLQSGKTKVQELEDKINNLEDELKKTKNESMRDHLTGLLTRKTFFEELKRIDSSYERMGTQYAIIFFDIDHFKKINDTFGHEGGDIVLSTFGKILNKSIRDLDIVGRYGGEEFIAIVHFKETKELLLFLKRIKSIVTENNFIYKDKQLKVTFSAGVTIRNSYKNYDEAINKADKLLYEAKKSGRNKIILENGMEF